MARGGQTAGFEHGSTLTSSVVARGARGGQAAGFEHGSTLTSSVVARDGAGRADGWF